MKNGKWRKMIKKVKLEKGLKKREIGINVVNLFSCIVHIPFET